MIGKTTKIKNLFAYVSSGPKIIWEMKQLNLVVTTSSQSQQFPKPFCSRKLEEMPVRSASASGEGSGSLGVPAPDGSREPGQPGPLSDLLPHLSQWISQHPPLLHFRTVSCDPENAIEFTGLHGVHTTYFTGQIINIASLLTSCHPGNPSLSSVFLKGPCRLTSK